MCWMLSWTPSGGGDDGLSGRLDHAVVRDVPLRHGACLLHPEGPAGAHCWQAGPSAERRWQAACRVPPAH
jgi:hypothetical protein